MATRVDSIYDKWSFTETEEEAAVVFTDLQTKHLQNQLVAAATEKAQMSPEGPSDVYKERQSYLLGQIELLSWLIANSDEHKGVLQRLAESQLASQQEE